MFGRSIGDYQLTQVKLARMAVLIQAARQFAYAVARLMAKGEGAMEASMVKAYVCKAAEWVTREAMQIHGGYGYAEEYPVSRLYVDARVLSIFEGADETAVPEGDRPPPRGAGQGRVARYPGGWPRPAVVPLAPWPSTSAPSPTTRSPAWVESMRLGFHRHLAEGEAEVAVGGLDLDRTWAPSTATVSWARCAPGRASSRCPAARSCPPRRSPTSPSPPPTAARACSPACSTADLRRRPPSGARSAGILIAAEYPIYGRFGYGPATEHATFTVDAKAARFGERRPGSVQLADLAELRKVGPGARTSSSAASSPARSPGPTAGGTAPAAWSTWPGEEPYKGYVLVGRSADGRARRLRRATTSTASGTDRRAGVVLVVDELLAATPEAYERLWRACCEVDWVARGAGRRSLRRRGAALAAWPTRGRYAQSDRADFLWLRPLDVPALLGSRTYLAPGRVVLEVDDPLGYAAGRYALDGGPDGATCARTTDEPGLTLGVDVLGAVALGGPSLRLARRRRPGDACTTRPRSPPPTPCSAPPSRRGARPGSERAEHRLSATSASSRS